MARQPVYTFTDASFVTGDSPVTYQLDVPEYLGTGVQAQDGKFINWGANAVTIAITDSRGDTQTVTLAAASSLDLAIFAGFTKVVVTWIADTSYTLIASRYAPRNS